MLHRTYVEEFAPPPDRYEAVGCRLHAALTSTGAAAVAFQEATAKVIDFDRLQFVERHLARASGLIQAITDPAVKPPAAPPAPKPKRRRKTDD